MLKWTINIKFVEENRIHLVQKNERCVLLKIRFAYKAGNVFTSWATIT